MRNATELHTRRLWDELMKEGEDTNVDQSVKGENPVGDPSRGPDEAALQFSPEVYEEYIKGRQRLLDDLSGHKDSATKADRALIAQQLEHGSGNFESRAVALEEKAHDPVKQAEASRKEAERSFFNAIR